MLEMSIDCFGSQSQHNLIATATLAFNLGAEKLDPLKRNSKYGSLQLQCLNCLWSSCSLLNIRKGLTSYVCHILSTIFGQWISRTHKLLLMCKSEYHRFRLVFLWNRPARSLSTSRLCAALNVCAGVGRVITSTTLIPSEMPLSFSHTESVLHVICLLPALCICSPCERNCVSARGRSSVLMLVTSNLEKHPAHIHPLRKLIQGDVFHLERRSSPLRDTLITALSRMNHSH